VNEADTCRKYVTPAAPGRRTG